MDFSKVKEISEYWITYHDGTKKPTISEYDGVNIRMTRFLSPTAVSDIEEIRWRIWEHIRTSVIPPFQESFDQIIKLGKAHAKPTHRFVPHSKKDWWLYSGNRGISYEWIKEPEKPINLEVGQAYYHASKRSDQWHDYASKANRVFNQAIFRWLGSNRSKLSKEPGIECLVINGRRYLFERTNKHGYVRLAEYEFPTAWEEKKFNERIIT